MPVFTFFQKQRFFVLGIVAALWAVGFVAMKQLPVEPVPDISPQQVMVSVTVPDLATEEVERLITFPIEASLTGIPGMTGLRSVSRTGVSVVYLQFGENTDIDADRMHVAERLDDARNNIAIPNVTVSMGPRATGMGEIMQLQIKGPGYSLMDLNRLMHWKIVPLLRMVPGVADVNVNGGAEETFQVALDPLRLRTYGITVSDVYQAVDRNNASAGGGWITHQAEQQVIVGRALIGDLTSFGSIPVRTLPNGTAIRLRDVGHVALGPMTRLGAVTRDGHGEVVTGAVLMQVGASSNDVLARIREQLPIIQQGLPVGVSVDPFYERSTLTEETMHTVKENLAIGALLVVAVLLVVLGDIRASFVIASAIPAALMTAMIGMRYFGVSANLLSLGAIDFGMIVDSSLVVVEHVMQLHSRNKGRVSLSRKEVAVEAVSAVVRPVSFAILVIILVYLPVLTLEGIEGKMFRPMAQSVVMALVASLLYGVIVIPVLAGIFLRGRKQDRESVVVRWVRTVYEPLLQRCERYRLLVLVSLVSCCVAAVWCALHLGGEFVPQLEEGDLTVTSMRLPSASLDTVLKEVTREEKILRSFPEVRTVVSTTGTAAIPTDPMGVNETDSYVLLKPRDQWRAGQTQASLVEAMNKALNKSLPSASYEWSQPIQMRMDDLLAGVRSELAISIYGDDLSTLSRLGDQVTTVLSHIDGAADVAPQGAGTVPFMHIDVDREMAARRNVPVPDILDEITAIGGREGRPVVVGESIIPTQIRLSPDVTYSTAAIGNLPIRRTDGQGWLLLSDVAHISVDDGASRIDRDRLQRRVLVQANVRGRDVSSFVSAAQTAVREHVILPPGYRIEWAGQFRNLQSAVERLSYVLPIALLLIFALLVAGLGSFATAVLIFVNIPAAACGGIFMLVCRGMPFSVAAGIGFIALFGVAILNGVVLVSQIQLLRKQGTSPREAAYKAAYSRLRPVLATASVAGIGFFPMAFSTGMGAEVEKPLASVVIGGLVSSTLLTLLILPTLYGWFFSMKKREEA